MLSTPSCSGRLVYELVSSLGWEGSDGVFTRIDFFFFFFNNKLFANLML